MKVKELERTVNIAWSPTHYHPILLAAGTAAQQLDASFNTSASLDLYSLNLSEPGQDLEQRCSVPSKNRFHRVAWGGTGEGIVVGGCDGGAIQVYSAGRILKGEDGLIAHQDRHNGPVRAIHFNPFQLNLMATGAGESDIFIWDLNNISTPMSPGSKTQPYEDVLSLAWNKQVQHILASTFHSRCIVWDLRKNEPIIKLTDSNSRVRWKEAAWHPDVATQLCLASEDDALPVIQLWDLRFATSPLRSLAQHSRGVLSMAWCNQDPDLLVSSGKDNRILCWNPNADHPTGLVQCEIVNVQQMIFEVAWCPRNPNLIACASADGHTSIYNLTASQTTTLSSNKIAESFPGMENLAVEQPAAQQAAHVELAKPPKWMRRPCGASFSFGGRLVWFGSAGGPSIIISQVEAEDATLSSRAEAALAAMDSGKAADLCKDRSDPLWSFLAAAFDPNPPIAICTLLGYPPSQKMLSRNKDIDNITNDMSILTQNDEYYGNINGSSAFDILAAKQEKEKDLEPAKPLASFTIRPGPDGEGWSVIKALLEGDMKTASENCLSEGHVADALLLASAAGPDVLASTQNEYFKSFAEKTSSAELIRTIVTGNWEPLVDTCDLDSWKEVLVAVLTYASPLRFPALSMALGRRLEQAGGEKVAGAEICYVAAGSFAALIRHRIASVTSANAAASSFATSSNLQELVEMVLVGRVAEQTRGSAEPPDEEVSRLLIDFALLLAADGHLQLALAYLGPAQGEVADELRESLLLNLGLKQHPPQSFPPDQRRPSGDPAPPRKFSHPASGREQFQKMTPVGAARANSVLSSGPPMVPRSQPIIPSGQPMVPTGQPMIPTGQSLSQPPASSSPALPPSGANNKKYLVDPSVGSNRGGGSQFSMGSQFPSSGHFSSSNQFNPSVQQPMFQQPGPIGPPSNPTQTPPPMAQGNNMPPVSSAQLFHNAPAGWNDPPILNTTRSQKRVEPQDASPAPPITHPIYGAAPDPHATATAPPHPGMRPPSHLGDAGPPPVGGGPPSSGGIAPPSQGTTFTRNQPTPSGPPPTQFGPPKLMGMPSQANQFGAPPSQGSQFGPPAPSGGQFGPQAPPSGQFGPPAPPSGQFGPPAPPSGQFGPPAPSSGQFGPPAPSSSQFGPPPPPSSQFGGPPPPQRGQFGAPTPQNTQFSAPTPQNNQQAGHQMMRPPPQQGSQFGGPHPQGTQFAHPPQGTQFGAHFSQGGHMTAASTQNSQFGESFPQSGQLGGLPPQSTQFRGAAPPQSGSFGTQAPISAGGMPLPPVQPVGSGIPPVQTSSQSTPSSHGGRSSGRSTPHQVNGGAGYGDPPLSVGPRQPLPQSCQRVQDVFELLRSKCHATSNNQQMKRKLDEVARKLELLYDALRESKLSVGSIDGLEAIVAQVEAGDYAGALTQHSRMAAGPDFSHIAAFMPALKLLIQSALQLNVYLS